jgi:hypothetical protein
MRCGRTPCSPNLRLLSSLLAFPPLLLPFPGAQAGEKCSLNHHNKLSESPDDDY